MHDLRIFSSRDEGKNWRTNTFQHRNVTCYWNSGLNGGSLETKPLVPWNLLTINKVTHKAWDCKDDTKL